MQRYNARHFIQSAPKDLLQVYLSNFGLTDSIDWSVTLQAINHTVFSMINRAPGETHRQIHRDFRLINQLANEEGIAMIRAEIHRRHMDEQVLPTLERYTSSVGQAFWAFLQEPQIFDYAYHFGIADMVKRWHRVCVRDADPLTSPEQSLERLHTALCSYFQECQGRGYGCLISIYPRDSRCYWFAYLQDYAKEVLLCDTQHQIGSEVVELAFQIIFVYDHETGTLAIAMDSDIKHLMDLQCLFGRVVLDKELIGNGLGELYLIQRFLDRHYPLPVYPEDRIASVTVQSIGIEFLGHRRSGFVVSAARDGNHHRVYDLLDSALSGFSMPRELITVSHVELYLTFRPEGGFTPKPRVVRITPRSCGSTRSPWDNEFRQLLIRWEIYDASSCHNTTPVT
ncbi:MAG TPA: hypothetical protein VHV83_15745 [Armatimonadota bacterium]|nr:hypothetical protein [Armatimonadota bacterium]